MRTSSILSRRQKKERGLERRRRFDQEIVRSEKKEVLEVSELCAVLECILALNVILKINENFNDEVI